MNTHVTFEGRLATTPKLQTNEDIKYINVHVTVADPAPISASARPTVPLQHMVRAVGTLAVNITRSLQQGDVVIVIGRQRSETITVGGITRTTTIVEADAMGPSLTYAPAAPKRSIAHPTPQQATAPATPQFTSPLRPAVP